MPNPYGAAEVSVQDVAARRQQGTPFVLLDVREPAEVARVSLGPGVEVAPLSDLARRQLDALPESARDKGASIVVFCHHGMRSAQVAAWLTQQGWTDVRSLAGGIDAYAREVDPTIGRY